MHLDDPVHDGDVPAIDVEDHNLPCAERLSSHVQEQDVPPVECWLHAATEHHHYLQEIVRVASSVAFSASI